MHEGKFGRPLCRMFGIVAQIERTITPRLRPWRKLRVGYFVLCGRLPFCKSFFVIDTLSDAVLWFGLLTRRIWPLALPLGYASIACRAVDGFHKPSPIPHFEQQAFRTKHGVSWFWGWQYFHHFIGLAIVCFRFPGLDSSHFVRFVTS